MDEWKHGNMKVWKYGNVEIWKYGNIELWKYSKWKFENIKIWNSKICRFGNMEVRKYGKGFQGILLNFNGLLGILYCFVWFYVISKEFQGVLGDFKVFRGFEGIW